MTERTVAVRTGCALPDDAIPVAVVEVTSYLNAEGEQCYAARFGGGEPVSTYLGLLALAGDRLLRAAEEERP